MAYDRSREAIIRVSQKSMSEGNQFCINLMEANDMTKMMIERMNEKQIIVFEPIIKPSKYCIISHEILVLFFL